MSKAGNGDYCTQLTVINPLYVETPRGRRKGGKGKERKRLEEEPCSGRSVESEDKQSLF